MGRLLCQLFVDVAFRLQSYEYMKFSIIFEVKTSLKPLLPGYCYAQSAHFLQTVIYVCNVLPLPLFMIINGEEQLDVSCGEDCGKKGSIPKPIWLAPNLRTT
jgi:hypothetical protein